MVTFCCSKVRFLLEDQAWRCFGVLSTVGKTHRVRPPAKSEKIMTRLRTQHLVPLRYSRSHKENIETWRHPIISCPSVYYIYFCENPGPTQVINLLKQNLLKFSNLQDLKLKIQPTKGKALVYGLIIKMFPRAGARAARRLVKNVSMISKSSNIFMISCGLPYCFHTSLWWNHGQTTILACTHLSRISFFGTSQLKMPQRSTAGLA